MPAASDPLATVQRMFAAFAAHDLDALVATIHPQSAWRYLGANPQVSVAAFSGSAAVRSFFERIIKRLDMTSFAPAQYIVQDGTVVVFGSEAGTVKADGRPFRNEWVQRYEVRDGLITAMVEYNIQIEPKS